MSAALFAGAMVAYNNLINCWPQFHRLYFPINVGVAAGIVVLALGPLDLRPADVGLVGNTFSEAGMGVAGGLFLASPLFIALVSPRTAKLIADRRLEDSSAGEALFRILFRVPLGTALLEEVAFRGVLFALLVPYGPVWAAAISSAAFGLWHVVPTIHMARANGVSSIYGAVAAVVAGVALTFAAGMIFVWLRVQTGGLAAPWAMHSAVNSYATLAAFLALRVEGVRASA
ncbi:MAG: CPBP family intramembrane metalloprotease [Actinomycetota bacterium]|nr:CPBP family intramembrane metalloprotease [Actinomycetota bacterium]